MEIKMQTALNEAHQIQLTNQMPNEWKKIIISKGNNSNNLCKCMEILSCGVWIHLDFECSLNAMPKLTWPPFKYGWIHVYGWIKQSQIEISSHPKKKRSKLGIGATMQAYRTSHLANLSNATTLGATKHILQSEHSRARECSLNTKVQKNHWCLCSILQQKHDTKWICGYLILYEMCCAFFVGATARHHHSKKIE